VPVEEEEEEKKKKKKKYFLYTDKHGSTVLVIVPSDVQIC
jgi:hypothetical protein